MKKNETLVIFGIIFLFFSVANAGMPNLKLPFSGGETWGITTGYNESLTHVNKDYYALDFNLAGDKD